jgi:hypothetical protein
MSALSGADFVLEVEQTTGVWVQVANFNAFSKKGQVPQTFDPVFDQPTPIVSPGVLEETYSVGGFFDPVDPGQAVLRAAEANHTPVKVRYLKDGVQGEQQSVLVSSFTHDAKPDGSLQTIVYDFSAIDTAIDETIPPATPTDLFNRFNALSGATMLALYVQGVNMTIDGGGHVTAWDDAVHPGQGKHFRPGAELPAGPPVANTLGGTNAIAGQIDLPASTGLTGGALFHGDPYTSADVIPGSSGLYKVFSDRTAGLTIGGVAKFVDGRFVMKLGEDGATDNVTMYGDDAGNVQALHVSPQWPKAQNPSQGADPMHWSVSIVKTSPSIGNGDAGGQFFLVWRYARDIMNIVRPGATTGAFDDLLGPGRRIRIAPATQSDASHHRCVYILQGTATSAQMKLLCDFFATQWPDMYDCTMHYGILLGDSYQEVALVGTNIRPIVEGESGAPAIPDLGVTGAYFWGHRVQHLLYPFYYFIAGCDFSKRPPTASVLISASEWINATGVTPGTPAADQNFYWLDAIRALDPARVRVAMHDLVYCCSTPNDQKGANVPLLTDYLAAHAVADGHAEVVVTFLDSVTWSSDPYWYGEGDVNRGQPGAGISPRLPWDGIHPSSLAHPLWHARYRAMWELLRGVDLSNRTIEVYASAPHVEVGVGGTATPTWTCKNRAGAALSGKTLTFSSASPSIATVDASTGVITGVAIGQAYIQAQSNDGGFGGCIVVVTGPDEITYLRANLAGGDAALLAMYSTEYGITLGSAGDFEPGSVKQWDDARGASGFGPSLTQFAEDVGQRPEWDATNKVVQFDGVHDHIETPTSAKFDLSVAVSLVLVGTFYQTSAQVQQGGITGASFAHILGPRSAAGASGTITVVDPNNAADSTVLVSATRRLVICSKNATTGLAIDVPNHARVAIVSIAQSAGNNILTIGSMAAASLVAQFDCRACLVINRQVDATDIGVLKTWAQTYHNAVLV